MGGTVAGLSGSGLVLQVNGGSDLPVATNGAFVFSSQLASGSDYGVTVLSQPTNPSQTCSVTNGSGTVAGANVSGVALACVTNTYSVGGTVAGLSGSGLVLQVNGGSDLPVTANGAFVFSSQVASGSDYGVTVLSQPTNPSQTCSVTNGSGTVAGANVSGVALACVTNTYSVGGTVAGLSGSGLVLQVNGGSDLPVAANGAFVFSSQVASGSDYGVTVLSQPTNPSQTCSVTTRLRHGGRRQRSTPALPLPASTNTYSRGWNGRRSLPGSGLVLQVNVGERPPCRHQRRLRLRFPCRQRVDYSVTVLSQPTNPSQTCSVTSGNGLVGSEGIHRSHDYLRGRVEPGGSGPRAYRRRSARRHAMGMGRQHLRTDGGWNHHQPDRSAAGGSRIREGRGRI